MDAVTYPDPAVQEELQSWLLRRFDVTAGGGVARTLGVVAVPTAVGIAPDGRILDRIVGFVEPQTFARRLADARARR